MTTLPDPDRVDVPASARQRWWLAWALVVLAPTAACIDRPITRNDPSPDNVEKKTLPISLANELDLLFVVDNSGSMLQEHQSLEARFPELIRALDELGPERPDLHIGVATSDMGTGHVAGVAGNCDATGGDGGHLHGASCPALGGHSFLVDGVGAGGARVTNYTGTLDAAFACMADVGTGGCGFEQHLASMKAALSPGVNPGFVRRTANLGVVILADEDDCSVGGDGLFAEVAPALGPRTDFRCFLDGVECDPVADPLALGPRTNCHPRATPTHLVGIDAYADFLRELKDRDDQVFVAAIVADPADPRVVSDANHNPSLAPSCTGGLGSAAPAFRLAGLVDSFGGPHHRETICTGDLGAALAEIGAALPPPPACFASPPADRDPIADGVQPECAVVLVTDPDTAARQEVPLPACSATSPRPCWKLGTDPVCTQTEDHWRLELERGAGSGPEGAILEVQCVVATPAAPPT